MLTSNALALALRMLQVFGDADGLFDDFAEDEGVTREELAEMYDEMMTKLDVLQKRVTQDGH
jgi:hypothetical protein